MDANDFDTPHPIHKTRVGGSLRALGELVEDAIDTGAARCGPYTLISVLGEGGYGVVYCAVQDPPIRRRVAIKVLKRGLESRQVLRRFELEQEVLGRIAHPCVSTILDAGMTDDGLPWFAMPLLDGSPLTTACDRDRLCVEERLRLFMDACAGVHAAHVQGVIHRDLKPANILVVLDESAKHTVHIIDFGIARAMAMHEGVDQTMTAEHCVIGTPAYMAPEQADGSGAADVRSDIFTMGLVLQELLTGVAPVALRSMWQSRGIQPPDDDTTARMRGLAGGRALRQRMRGDLAAIIARATMEEPAMRYQSADALRTDIAHALAHRPITARQPSLRYIVGRLVRRHRLRVIASAVVALALCGLALFATLKSVETAHHRSIAAREAQRAADMNGVVRGLFSRIGVEVAKGRDPALLAELIERSANGLASSLPDRDIVSASQVAAMMSRALIDLERPRQALSLLATIEPRVRSDLDHATLAASPESHRELLEEHARLLLEIGDAHAKADSIEGRILQPHDSHRAAFEAWRMALDATAARAAISPESPKWLGRLSLEAAIGLWRYRQPWPLNGNFDSFDASIAARVNELDDSDSLKWRFLLRSSEINSFAAILKDMPPLLERATTALGAEHPDVIRWKCRWVRMLVGAGVESRAKASPGTPEFKGDALRRHWVTTEREGQETVALATRVLGPTHRITLEARIWWLQARGYAFGPAEARDGFAQLRRDYQTTIGPDCPALVEVDAAARAVERGEADGLWWK